MTPDDRKLLEEFLEPPRIAVMATVGPRRKLPSYHPSGTGSATDA